MKKLFCLIIFLVFSFILTNRQIFAVDYYSKYTRYSTDSLIKPSSASWESNRVQYPNVIYDEGIYKMWYSGHNGVYWSVGYATSLDGINWYKYPFNPILTWDLDINKPKNIITPTVIKDNGLYKMWFTSSFTDRDNYDFTIGYATSSDGIQWAIQNFQLLKPSQNWDLVGLTHPYVLKINDNEYYLYYSGRTTTNWNIGYATSLDGINWLPYINNPIITSTGNWWEKGSNLGPHVIYSSSPRLFKMWYSTESLGQGSSSMAYAESIDGNTWTKPSTNNPILNRELTGYFDDRIISDGSIRIEENTIFLWYGAKGFNSIWNIGLSYYGTPPIPQPTIIPPTPEPTITPTPEPTATPSLTPTPTPTPLPPIVIIPGIFSSWNKEEMLENKQNTNTEWKLLGFIKEYDGLIKTLKGLGYIENKNLFIWPYDWRQTIASTANKLNNFITTNVETKNPNTKITFIGHSLGGLVARTWTQSNSDKVQHLVTVGTPNQGAIQPYSAWEGGVTSPENSSLSFATQLLLQLNKKRFQTNRETMQQMFPVLKDLLPTQPYLIQKSNNTEITKNQMHVWNTWQETLNSAVIPIYQIFDAITGMNINTPNRYIVTQPDRIDSLLGNWEDGKPDSTQLESGDGTVTNLRSAFLDDPSHALNKNHGELIASKEGIQKILDILAIDHTKNQILEGTTTTFAPGLLFLLQSPATILITANGQEYHDQDGILYIPNAQSGNYLTKITGTGNGKYHLTIGQFGTNNTVWSSFTKPIQNTEQHTYTVSFQPTNPLPMPVTNLSNTDVLFQIDNSLQLLEKFVDKRYVQRLRIELSFIKLMLERRNYLIVKIQIETFLHSIAHIPYKNSAETIQIIFDIDDLLRHLYTTTLQNKSIYFSDRLLKIEQAYLDKELTRLTKIMINKNVYTIQDLILIQRGQEAFNQGKLQLKDRKLVNASFLFALAHSLFETH